MNKDMESAIEDNIASPNKNLHGSINHLSMRKLMSAQNKVNEQEELLVHNLNSFILVDVRGMSEEIIPGIRLQHMISSKKCSQQRFRNSSKKKS